jgi:protein-S-isoprenylcysteine O-methyltransferase Ste14
MLQAAPYFILIALWIAWILPFVTRRRGGGQKASITVRNARWGMILQGIAFGIASIHLPWQPPPSVIRTVIAIAFGLVAVFFAWASTTFLGKQWRFDAALNPDHNLIQTGPYAIVRHPIYASMLLMVIATALLVSNWIVLAIALVFYFIGTEIRVRIEENLLVSRFGNDYEQYRRRVSAYLPGVR